MTLLPAPAETQSLTCTKCGAALVPDQRYCLECGAPSSPVRLAFLDVLEGDRGQAAAGSLALEQRNGAFGPPDALSASGWLRRNAAWLLLLSVLLLCLIAGLLIGHWASQGKQTAGGPTVIKVEGLGALPAAAGAGTSTTPAASESTSGGKASAKEEAQAAKEVAKETKQEKAPPPEPKKASSTLQKASKTTGKKHEEEINALGAQPIETG